MYAGECMWIRSSVTQTRMHCTACSPRAEGSDELKTCDVLFQVDSVQQQIRAAPVDADLRFDRKYKLECMNYMFIVCPLHANYMSIGSTTATTTSANSFSLPKSSLLLYGRDFLILVGITRSKVICGDVLYHYSGEGLSIFF